MKRRELVRPLELALNLDMNVFQQKSRVNIFIICFCSVYLLLRYCNVNRSDSPHLSLSVDVEMVKKCVNESELDFPDVLRRPS